MTRGPGGPPLWAHFHCVTWTKAISAPFARFNGWQRLEVGLGLNIARLNAVWLITSKLARSRGDRLMGWDLAKRLLRICRARPDIAFATPLADLKSQ